jgi:ribosome hibernation promoting factor
VQIKISARHGHLSDDLQQHIRDKAEKLVHLFPRLMMIEVIVDYQQENQLVEFLVSAEHKHDFVASERNKDLLAAVDIVMSKLEGQIRKYKEKVQNHHRGSAKGEMAGDKPSTEE